MREMPHELKESEFQATFSPPMQDVTKTTGEVVDLWAYADPVLLQTYPNSGTWEWCVKHIYESADGAFQHVFIPVPEDNVYLVVVIDMRLRIVLGHRRLDLGQMYGVGKR
jgi:hypothetical protein